MKDPTGYTIYDGPSLLDGTPIVAIAITAPSKNTKTGALVQTYILRKDKRPSDAVRDGTDSSICGDCKHRPFTGGACYVVVAQGPTVVYKKWLAGGYPDIYTAPNKTLSSLGSHRVVRLGTYGDPAAVPARIWQRLVLFSNGHTGYTHQWGNDELSNDQMFFLRRLCMASVDSTSEHIAALRQGWRTFRVRTEDEPVLTREFICPASEEGNFTRTCATCKACNGNQARTRAANPVIIVHGSKHKRFATAPVS